MTNSSTPSTLFSRASHFGIAAAQVRSDWAGSEWQEAQLVPAGPAVFQSAVARSSTSHMAGLIRASRLSRCSIGAGRFMGSSRAVLNFAGDFSVFRKATISPISDWLKMPCVPQGGITVSGL